MKEIALYDFDAEQAVLCCMFMDRDSAMLAKEMLASDDFYGMANRRVFEAACAVLNNGKELDVVTAVNYLKEHGWFEAVSGGRNQESIIRERKEEVGYPLG